MGVRFVCQTCWGVSEKSFCKKCNLYGIKQGTKPPEPRCNPANNTAKVAL